jgi:sodium/potassium-transporting ATPase subunit beta
MPNFRTTLIRFEQGKPASYKPFSDHIQAVLYQYENQNQESEAFIDCYKLAEADRNKNKACRFQIDSLGPECVWQRDYGYDEGQPCVLLKLNKIFNWEPDLYDETDFPSELGNRTNSQYIGVTCEGENPIDQENIGPLKYWPPEGFPRYYYPYRNQEGYRSPLVMVKFAKLTNGVVINVWCKAWARNIRHHRFDDMGSVHFELLVH